MVRAKSVPCRTAERGYSVLYFNFFRYGSYAKSVPCRTVKKGYSVSRFRIFAVRNLRQTYRVVLPKAYILHCVSTLLRYGICLKKWTVRGAKAGMRWSETGLLRGKKWTATGSKAGPKWTRTASEFYAPADWTPQWSKSGSGVNRKRVPEWPESDPRAGKIAPELLWIFGGRVGCQQWPAPVPAPVPVAGPEVATLAPELLPNFSEEFFSVDRGISGLAFWAMAPYNDGIQKISKA